MYINPARKLQNFTIYFVNKIELKNFRNPTLINKKPHYGSTIFINPSISTMTGVTIYRVVGVT